MKKKNDSLNISDSTESQSDYMSCDDSSSSETNSGEEDLNDFLYESSNVTLKDLSLSLLVLKYKHLKLSNYLK